MAKGFNQKTVRDTMNSAMDRIDKAIIRRMQYLGEMLVNHARENGTYTDQTGNLRSSIGYVLTKDGVIIAENFEKVGKGGDDGPTKAKQFAKEKAAEHKKGYSLVCVAGMNYSDIVQSRGLDVLDGAEMLAKSEFPRMISELKLNIKKMKV